MRTASLLLVVGLLAGPLLPVAAAQPQLDVIDEPEVVVANDPETMADDPETEEYEFNPEYVFSAAIRVTNDADQRNVQPEAIVYADQSIEDSCPQDRQAFPVAFVFKNLNLSANEQVRVGGETDQREAQGEEYWPMAVSRTYQNARTGENVSIEEGPHTFCAALRTTGDDPACDRQANRTCVVATAPFQSYVRRSNDAPHITSMSASPENPRPGQTTLLSAEAVDNSTQPSPDDLSYTWEVGSDTLRGPNVQHAFATEEVHEVQLTVSDGFDEVNRTMRVAVGNATIDQGPTNDTPGPGVALLVASVGLVALARRSP